MPRQVPIKKADVVGTLDLPPVLAAGEYYTSIAQAEYFVKPPNADTAGDMFELSYIKTIFQHKALRKLQKEYLLSNKRVALNNIQRIRDITKVQEHLRRRFISVNNFIRDCADKKAIAESSCNDELLRHDILNKDITYFKKSLTKLKSFRRILRDTLEDYTHYEHVINNVVKKSVIFASRKDCIDRCDALMLAQVEIVKLKERRLIEFELMRKKMLRITKDAALTVLGLKNDLARLVRLYNTARSVCLKWEKILANSKHALSNNELNKMRTMEFVRSIFGILLKRSGPFEKHQVYNTDDDKLNFIKTEIELLQSVLKELPYQKFKRGNIVTVNDDDKELEN